MRGAGWTLLVGGMVAIAWFFFGASVDPNGTCGQGAPIIVNLFGYADSERFDPVSGELVDGTSDLELVCERSARALTVRGLLFGAPLAAVGAVLLVRANDPPAAMPPPPPPPPFQRPPASKRAWEWDESERRWR